MSQKLFDFTDFLLYNKSSIVSDIKPKVLKLLNKRKYFKGQFLLEYDRKLKNNIYLILRDYLMDKLELSYIETEEMLSDCKLDLDNLFLDKDIYGL